VLLAKEVHVTSADAATADLSPFAGSWVLDPKETTVTFRTKSLLVLPVNGTLKALNGDAQVSGGDVRGTLVIDAASIDTKNNRRDTHLRSKDFLEVVTYPTIVFTANSARPAGPGRVEVTGVLTVHGQNQPLTLQAELNRSGTSATVSTQIEIDRNLWGVSWGGKILVGNVSRFEIRAAFKRA
jgi:polyisoprenoid-binding protein YceI